MQSLMLSLKCGWLTASKTVAHEHHALDLHCLAPLLQTIQEECLRVLHLALGARGNATLDRRAEHRAAEERAHDDEDAELRLEADAFGRARAARGAALVVIILTVTILLTFRQHLTGCSVCVPVGLGPRFALV